MLHDSGCCRKFPTSSSTVIAGTFAREFLELPEEVLTTTLIHHQHYFPVEGEDGKLKEAFLAVINIEPDNERTIARNAERVVTARLRDARFFWEADRKVTLDSRIDRLSTLLFHKKLGSYKAKIERIEKLARTIAKEAFGGSDEVAGYAATAARLSKADLTTDMVREFPELQGVMGGIYARAEGSPKKSGRLSTTTTCRRPSADAPPSKAAGQVPVTWAAVSLADKLATPADCLRAARPTGPWIHTRRQPRAS
jgi:glycyl-tRNA synthetase beta chain